MAFPTPAAVFLDENLPIHRGKRADGLKAKPLKPSAKPGLQERKALRDVSNAGKPPVPNISKGTALKERPTLKERSILKERSALHNHEATKNPVKKTVIFADEETTKCHEWAKDGVEGTHFRGNDAQKLDKDRQDKRVKKKVEKIMSALHSWSDVVFDPVVFPAKEVAMFFEEVKELELEHEVLPDFNRRVSSSGDRAKLSEDSSTEVEHDQYPSLENKPVEFQLRDEAPFLDLGVN